MMVMGCNSELAGFPPKVYLIGAQKAGTTFLADLLDQHPDIVLSRPKEPAFYTANWERGGDWYRSCFASVEGRVLLDATPAYTLCPLGRSLGEPVPESRFGQVPERIRQVAPDARFIYLLRDPVARTYSAYWHFVKTGIEGRSLRDAVAEDDQYISASNYHAQLMRYLRCFPRESILTLFFEDLRADPAAAVSGCCRFLGLPDFTPDTGRAGKNSAFTLSGSATLLNSALQPVGGVKKVADVMKPWVPVAVKAGLKKVMTKPVPAVTEVDRRWLKGKFQESNERLAELLEVDLDRVWR